MHVPINVKSPNNTSKWQMGFNSAFKGLNPHQCALLDYNCIRLLVCPSFSLSVGSSVCPHLSAWLKLVGFTWNLMLGTIWKTCRKIPNFIPIRKKVGHFILRPKYYYFFYYAMQPLRLIVRSWLDIPTFATRRLHVCHHARAPSGGRWNCEREMSSNFV
jgi:hypothetical protein